MPSGETISMDSVGGRRPGSPSDEVCGVCDGVWTDSDVPLLDELDRLIPNNTISDMATGP